MDESSVNLILLIFVIIIAIALYYSYLKQNEKPKIDDEMEKFNLVFNQNLPTNIYDMANNLEYGVPDMAPISNNPNEPQGPSSDDGVNQNNNSDIYDSRGYKWTTTGNDPNVDVFTDIVDNQQLRNNFERTYMLDPTGDLAKYDIANSPINLNCCPAQYSPPFKVTNDNESNCDFAQKYVANQYSGMNYKNGYGCTCMTPQQAHFYGSRGGNST
jgi:hypothetical protein